MPQNPLQPPPPPKQTAACREKKEKQTHRHQRAPFHPQHLAHPPKKQHAAPTKKNNPRMPRLSGPPRAILPFLAKVFPHPSPMNSALVGDQSNIRYLEPPYEDRLRHVPPSSSAIISTLPTNFSSTALCEFSSSQQARACMHGILPVIRIPPPQPRSRHLDNFSCIHVFEDASQTVKFSTIRWGWSGTEVAGIAVYRQQLRKILPEHIYS